MKANAAQVRAALDAPKPAVRLYLFHGPDEAGAADLAARLQRAMGPEAERVDLDPKVLRDRPGALADEAASLSLFGTRRWIRIAGIDDSAADAVALLLDAETAGNPVVGIGPGLKTGGRLLKLVLAAPGALAHGCYLPTPAEAATHAAMIAREKGLRLTDDVARHLAAASAGDRAVLASEVEKLALFLDAAPDRPREADAAALEAVGADLGEVEMFDVIATVLEGRVDAVGRELQMLSAGGGLAIPLLRQIARRLIAIGELRIEVDAGTSVDQVLERNKVFFRERPATTRILRRWNASQIARAIDRLRETERAMMSAASAGDVLAEAESVAVARAAARGRA